MPRFPRPRLAALAAGLAAVAVGLAADPPGGSRPRLAGSARPDMWKKVEDAVSKGLPQTAVKELEPILASALADKAYPEAVKALAKKIALEGTVQGNKPEEKIARLRAAVPGMPKEMHPVLNAILAHWYWHHFQQNRWRYVGRTAGAPVTDDPTTWDLPRVFAEIDRHFTAALADDKTLKAIPVGAYDALLEKGTVPDRFRPTLWDFLAFEAISFYQSPEQAGARPQDDFEVDAGGPALGSADEFLKWDTSPAPAAVHGGLTPPARPEVPRLRRAVELYQAVLRFHKDDADRSAFLDADLHRLAFAHAVGVGPEKEARYRTALQRFYEQYAAHELSAVARHRFAELLVTAGEPDVAHKVAAVGAKQFPDTPGGKLCANLVAQIEAPTLELRTERVWAHGDQRVRVDYRNLTKVHFRAYKADWVKQLGYQRYRPEYLTPAEREAMLGRKPDAAWSADLPATPDFRPRSETANPPRALEPGFYFLFAGPDAGFPVNAGRPLFVTDVWVSDLALVVRYGTGGVIDGLVTDATTGEPKAGATVRTWGRQNTGRHDTGPETTTGPDGRFRIAGRPNQNGWLILASADGYQLSAGNEYYPYGRSEPNPHAQAVVFTDRAIYRPGQAVRFKGIALHVDQARDNYKVLPDKEVTVQFTDPNGKEIAKLDLRTNAYGSFSGSFTAPRDRLLGAMSLQVSGAANGGATVRVEEYKRPQFVAELDAPKDPAKLGGVVALAGKATAYTGAAVGGAKVQYRVVREVRFPEWWYTFCWWRVPPAQPAQEIAHGVTATEADGTFKLSFPAVPDKAVDPADEPVFSFTVTADVTDTTGETRTATRTVKVGYTALAATVSADDWQTASSKVKLTVATRTHDGDGQAAKGKVTVHRLKQPAAVVRPDILGDGDGVPRPLRRGDRAAKPADPDPADPRSWDLGEAVATLPFETTAGGNADVTAELPAGIYRAVLETADGFGKPVTAKHQVTVVDPSAATFGVKVPNFVAAPKWSAEPGDEFAAVWGTGYDAGRAYVEVEHRGKTLQAYWTDPGRTQATIRQKVTDAMRGGFTLRVTYVRENRAYLEVKHVDVPWTNKQLTVKWERFVSKLAPGQKETLTAVVSGPGAQKAVAEVAAAMYDASLDAFVPHAWPAGFGVFRQDMWYRYAQFENAAKPLNLVSGSWPQHYHGVARTYRRFPDDVTANLFGYEFFRDGKARGGRKMAAPAADAPAPGAPADGAADMAMEAGKDKAAGGDQVVVSALTEFPSAGPDLSQVAARSNLAETAFFFPHLEAAADGTVRITFTAPDALTRWKLLAFAHDKELRSGLLTDELVTAKDLMVRPNPPRFLREGDVVEFTVKVSNQSPTRQAGAVRLTLTDARTGNPVDGAFANTSPDRAFDIPAKESQTVAWRLTVPDGQGPVIYKAVGASDKLSDGEEGMLPVLSRRVLVTESLPLPVRDKGVTTFDFAKLRSSAGSDTLRTQSLTVEMTSNPAWYAVLALPYLMEFPHECSEQTFNRLYANALARHVAGSDPKVGRVFDQWKNTPALDSPLEKNADVKAVTLAESPWVRAAEAEGQARRNVGVLFDDQRLADELGRAFAKLADMQGPDGAWPWFPGGPRNDYLTLYIAAGFGRLRHLGVKDFDMAPAIKAVPRLDALADHFYRELKRHNADMSASHLSPTVALYLYGRSFFLNDVPVADEHKEAVGYWRSQAKAHWLKLADRQSQAHVAVGLKRFGDKATPAAVVASIRERSVADAEMGMYWRDTEVSHWWYRAPIETQAMMVELFDEVAGDRRAVEECKVWLLKQKQTRDWKTTKATADAVYALLLRGTDLLKSDALVEVTLGGEKVVPDAVEAGTGFYRQKFVRSEARPDMGRIRVTKADPGVAWGAVHWQYLEDVAKVTPAGGPLSLEKQVLRRVLTAAGPRLEAIRGSVQVGDELVTRVVLRADRDMEYIHLKDHRGSGTEPVNVLSRYKYQDGLAYYEATRDAATDFFIDYLPKGTYVFEYPVRVQLRGQYPTGVASAQCMYAPEFNSHSGSVALEVR